MLWTNSSGRRSKVDPYVYPGTRILRNKAGLQDAELLAAHESRMVFKRMLQLYAESLPGTLDGNYLAAIHHALFQDVYFWAGHFRTGEMSIGGRMFCRARIMLPSLTTLLIQLIEEHCLAGLKAELFAERAAFYLGELNTIHPFRDGNGRTQREFLRALGLRAGHKVRWAAISQFEMVNASKLSFATGRPNASIYVMREAIGLGV